MWHYLGTKRSDFRHENNSTSRVLIEEIWNVCMYACMYVCVFVCMHAACVYVCMYVCIGQD